MNKGITLGRRALFWGALALILHSIWALYTRLDTLYRPLKMFFAMALGEGIPLSTAMGYFDWGIFQVPARLAVEVLAALIALGLKRRPFAGFFLIPVCAALAGWSLTAGDTVFSLPGQLMECLPLLLMILGSLCQLIGRLCLPRRTIAFIPAPTLTSAPRLQHLAAPDAIHPQHTKSRHPDAE